MARGFESKAVADQQESAGQPIPGASDRQAPDPALVAHRRGLELARVDVSRRLAEATAAPHREMLTRALAALDSEIAGLD